MSQSIFGRSIGPTGEPRRTMEDFLEEPVEPGTELGWAGAYTFQQLQQQITDISGELDVNPDTYEDEDPNVESSYEGFMSDALRQLIEGE